MSTENNPPEFVHWPKEADFSMATMTLRDWFAGQALAGILAHHGTQCFGWTKSGHTENSAHGEAYKHADAMLVARNASIRPQ